VALAAAEVLELKVRRPIGPRGEHEPIRRQRVRADPLIGPEEAEPSGAEGFLEIRQALQ
jgi:hypothetical protein